MISRGTSSNPSVTVNSIGFARSLNPSAAFISIRRYFPADRFFVQWPCLPVIHSSTGIQVKLSVFPVSSLFSSAHCSIRSVTPASSSPVSPSSFSVITRLESLVGLYSAMIRSVSSFLYSNWNSYGFKVIIWPSAAFISSHTYV